MSNMNRKIRIISFALIVGILILLAGVALVMRGASSGASPLLQDAAKEKLAGVDLRDPRDGNRDCYPANTNKTSCPSITYIVDKDTCTTAKGKLTKSSDQNSSDCTNAYDSFTYQGKKIGTFVGEGRKGEYWVQLWLEDDL